MSKSIVKLIVSLSAAALALVAMITVNVGAFGQNASSSTTEPQNANSSMMMEPSGNANRQESAGMSTDLSGTYAGTVSYSEHDMNGEATLTISGESYTLVVGSMTHSGKFLARTTGGYTTAALELGPTEAGQTPTWLSLRVCKRGDNLSLKSVPGEMRKFSFRTRGSARGGRGDCCRCGRSDM